MNRLGTTFWLGAVGLGLAGAPAWGGGADASVSFDRDVRPVLSENCFACHGPDEQARKAELRLDTREGALGADDAVIVPGDSSRSELIQRITTSDPDDRMPPPDSNLALSVGEIATLRKWIDEGAKWAAHWAYVPPVRPALPSVENESRVRTPIDRFILARLEAAGLRPSDEASREALIRRASLDLTGLPPALEEVDAFLADDGPQAYERLVDRLLNSPHYGERMAWDWLDAARYADSNGYQGDSERTMWPWRDWVIEAFNDNLPYDRFTVLQIAGDLLPDPTREQRIATGFNRNHMINGEGGRIPEENRVEYVFDQVETVATVWLGLTWTCARCHDHKFDPFTQEEYYRLFAYFNNTPVTGAGRSGQMAPVVDFTTAEQREELKRLRETVKQAAARVTDTEKELFPREAGQSAAESPAAEGLSGNLVAQLKRPADRRSSNGLDQLVKHFREGEPGYGRQLAALKNAVAARDRFDKGIPRVMVMEEQKEPRETNILIRGAYNKPADAVKPGLPASLPGLGGGARDNRLGLARWLVHPEHPLTARVTVNREWQRFFGTGLVKTTEDFGVQGEKPSHPDLLDWLAVEFVESGWDLKHLHRLILTSAVYRQTSRTSPGLVERDPGNRLLARAPRYRLPSWMIRDQALALSGLLVDRVGGPPVYSYQPKGIWKEATFGKKEYRQDNGAALYRRSLYTFWRRIVGPPVFFDSASRQTCEVKMQRTNSPLHALVTLNDVTFIEAARAMAARLLTVPGESDAARVETAFRMATSRHPRAEEKGVLLKRLEILKQQFAKEPEAAAQFRSVGDSSLPDLDPVEHAAWAALCSLILNLDEVISKQ